MTRVVKEIETKMKHVIPLLLLLMLSTTFSAGCGGMVREPHTVAVNLTWDAPTKNADGTTLIDIAGYRVFFGETSLKYPNSVMIFGTATTASIGNLRNNGTVYFAVSAFNIYGYLSSYSVEFQVTLS
jgi:hypothetical protein